MNDKEMIGKQVVKITSDGDSVTFHHSDNEYDSTTYNANGDCCSNSWIEHFDEVTSPETIVSFEENEIDPYVPDSTKTDNYEECMQYYFYKLKTDKGEYNIEMRNSSNGYYGGWLS